MISTIVVPLDRSPAAERALPFAEVVAKQINAGIVLLSVIDLPLELEAWLEAQPVADVRREIESEYREYLSEVAERIDRVPVDTVVRFGAPVTQIQKFVGSLPDALVIMASHGHSGFRRLIAGSVTQQLVHRLLTPVIVVPASVPDPLRPPSGAVGRILVPLDGSPFAEHALRTGLNIFGSARPDLVLLRVVEIPVMAIGVDPAFDVYAFQLYLDAVREVAEEYLDEMSVRLADEGYPVSIEVRIGSVVDEINSVAEEYDVDLLVMGTHGRSGINRLIFGSVAEAELRLAPVPLMVVRPDEAALMESEEAAQAEAPVNSES